MADQITATSLWRPTNAPYIKRYEDVWFVEPNVGWAISFSEATGGAILKTTNGGDSWEKQFARKILFRSLAFVDSVRGWVGTLNSKKRLFNTSDGGKNWKPVSLPPAPPSGICGIWPVDESVTYGVGTFEPQTPPGMIKTLDGGQTWSAQEMSAHASTLVDVYFPTPDRGWVVGGYSEKANPTIDDLMPIVLFTQDGGRSWVNQLEGMSLPVGSWCWKIQFLNDDVGFVSVQNFYEAMILKTTNGGARWSLLPVNNNSNIQGIGFLNEDEGWVGGWGNLGDSNFDQGPGTSNASYNGGLSWSFSNEIGIYINRFRFNDFDTRGVFTNAYAAGLTVYKLELPDQQ